MKVLLLSVHFGKIHKMRKIIFYASSLALLFVLAGCPINSSYPLGIGGEVTLDKSIIGTWSTENEDAEVQEFTLSAASKKNIYKVHVEKTGEMFSADGEDFLGWFTIIDKSKFFVLQQIVDGSEKDIYYVYHITYEKNKLITHDISLKVNGVDAITSIDAYREEVKKSMKFDDFLASEIVFTRK